jgi:RimJ/RimL family protein N-acetyltransferase
MRLFSYNDDNMIYEAKEFVLKNGLKVVLRSPEKEDAHNLINQIISVASSTDYLLSTPSDFQHYVDDISKEEAFIEWSKTDSGYWLIACVEDKIVANCSLRFYKHEKDKHRGTIGIAITEEYQSIGIGSLMFDEMIKLAKNTPGVEQIELDVIDENAKARRLYSSKGFVITGSIPRQLKLKDGTYLDGITMVLFLNK